MGHPSSMSSEQTKNNSLRSNILVAILMLATIVLGGTFRFWSVNWDDFAYLHPDERFLTLNLLPNIGGNLQFTTDEEHFPAHAIVVNTNNVVLTDTFELQLEPTLRLGVIDEPLTENLSVWWLQDDSRIVVYQTLDAALQGLSLGDVTAVMAEHSLLRPRIETNQVRQLGLIDSPTVQNYRCQALFPDTNGVAGYFNTDCSSLNPYHAGAGTYAYGTLPLFMAHVGVQVTQWLEANNVPFVDFQSHALVWRVLSAFFDVGTIILVFLIGRRMHNKWVGLIAAILYACFPLAIHKAHFGTVNAITNFFVTLAIFAAVAVQDTGKLRWYTLFGFAFGCALAGRINVIPLAGLVVLAGMINAAPVLDKRITWHERERLFWRNIIGIFLAGFVSVLVFRVVNPYAFIGPTFFHAIPSMRWLADAQQSSKNVSGVVDSPPNWQWLGRIGYLYPLRDMLLWGMGIASGLLAWFGFAWSGVRLARGRQFALRNILIFAWVAVYFAWIGNLWVMTMRYYLPLYGSFALFAAWALYEFTRQQNSVPERIILGMLGIFFAGIPAVALTIGTALTGTLFASGIVGITLFVMALLPVRRHAYILGGFTIAFTLLWALMFTNIYRNQVTRIQAARWQWENIEGDFYAELEGAPDGTPLINIDIRNKVPTGASQPTQMRDVATEYIIGRPMFSRFTAPADGVISSINSPHIVDPNGDPDPETLYISIARNDNGDTELLQSLTIEQDFPQTDHPLGASYEFEFDEPIQIQAGVRYEVKVELISEDFTDRLLSSGAVVLTEGDWDDRITSTMICTLPYDITLADNPPSGLMGYDECAGRSGYGGLVQSYDLAMSYPEDNELKRNSLLNGLRVGEYLAITSNRFYDTETRNPVRFPLTTRYYEALFNEELGYELVEVFNEGYQFAGLSVSDQHLPTYDSPAWLNELEPDEAFTVYDHPVVFIFKKSDDYDHNVVENILGNVPLTRPNQVQASGELGSEIVETVYWTSLEADEAPTALQMYPDMAETNQSGGTWSERFNSDSILNANQPVGVAVWWLAIIVLGWSVFPLVNAAFPKLADGGYGVAKIISLLLIGWISWVLSSLKLPMWNQLGLLVITLSLTALSAYVGYRRRETFIPFLKQNLRLILSIEVIALVLYLVMIGVRLTNPDLWHHPMGGEKPMDFAYFNAVLRSTVFPAYDPWYSGGFINYYYVGYVIVGVPVLLLKIVPAFAYNLIIPTLFALTGIGAFSAAFNIVASWQTPRAENTETEKAKHYLRMGNPYLAGLAALLLCAVLGNLDIPRVLLTEGVAKIAGYQRPLNQEEFYTRMYREENDANPEGEALFDIQNRTSNPNVIDNIRYEISIGTDMWSRIFRGVGPALSGQILPMGTNRWYWAPTRVIMETPGVGGNAIAEMPAFTFIYGDLHAHMIAMPLMLFAILFIFYEVKVAQDDRRKFLSAAFALFLGALTIGMFRAINTWDYPTFMLFGVVGLGYAWWRRWETISRHSIAHMLIFIGGFLTMAIFVAKPYTEWYTSVYNSVSLWEGGKTPLWAYWNVYGLYLFLIVSLLIWDTARILRQTQVRALRGQGYWVIGIGMVVALALLGSVIAALMDYQVALIVVPLITWIAILFFHPKQSEPLRFVYVLIGLALALSLGVEVIRVDGDIDRQNTLFKFYIQAWILLSVAGGCAFGWLANRSDYWSNRERFSWYIPLTILVAVAAMFPLMATRARSVDRFSYDVPLTLNGLDYMPYANHNFIDYPAVISLENDYEVIRWLQENVEGTPVTLEGRSYNGETNVYASEYRYNGRIAINTGLPTILGWNWHQRQQRTLDPLPTLVEYREDNVNFLYVTQNIVQAVDMLRHFDVQYIVLSDMELTMYPSSGIAKFTTMREMGLLEQVFAHGSARIYRVNEAAMDDFSLHHTAFYGALGADNLIFPNTDFVIGLNESYVPDDTVEIQPVLQTFAEYEMTYLTINNLAQIQSYAPQVYDQLIKLENQDVLEIFSESPARRIYTVNQSAVDELLGDS